MTHQELDVNSDVNRFTFDHRVREVVGYPGAGRSEQVFHDRLASAGWLGRGPWNHWRNCGH